VSSVGLPRIASAVFLVVVSCRVLLCSSISVAIPTSTKSHHYYHLRNTSNTVSTTTPTNSAISSPCCSWYLVTVPHRIFQLQLPPLRLPSGPHNPAHVQIIPTYTSAVQHTYTRQYHYNTSQSPLVSDPYTTAPLQLCRPETLRPRHHVLSHQPPLAYTAGDSS